MDNVNIVEQKSSMITIQWPRKIIVTVQQEKFVRYVVTLTFSKQKQAKVEVIPERLYLHPGTLAYTNNEGSGDGMISNDREMILLFFINEQVRNKLFRPPSNKHKSNGFWGYAGREEREQSSNGQANARKKKVKLMKPDLTTNDFGRILPRKMYKDRERLYSQGLQLKTAINEISDQNTRLKTQVSVLQREKYRVSRLTQSGESLKGTNHNRQQSRNIRVHDRDGNTNTTIRNLKRMLKQYKQQNIAMHTENKKIRKTMKYIKINQLEIELKIVIEENQKLGYLLEQYVGKVNQNDRVQKQYQDLKVVLEREYSNSNRLGDDNQRLAEEIAELEDRMRGQMEKWRLKENKLVREMNHERKKAIQHARHNQDLKRELKSLMEVKQSDSKRKTVKSAHRNPPFQPNAPMHQSQLSRMSDVDQEKNARMEQESVNLKAAREAQVMIKEISLLKSELEMARNDLARQRENKKNQGSPLTIEEYSNSKFQSEKVHMSGKSKPENEESEIKVEAIYDDEDFEASEEFKTSEKDKDKGEVEELIKIKKEFDENGPEEELFKKENRGKARGGKSAKKKKEKSPVSKPNKAVLMEIRQLLTYRMKSQRYPFSDLQTDIESSEVSAFNYGDLTEMLLNQPFYLNKQHAAILLRYCYGKETIGPKETLDNKILTEKLKKVIGEFTLMSQEHEKEMIIKIAQMTSTYPQELQLAFEDIKNGNETVAKKDLIEMFKKLSLEQEYIDLIVAQLSLCSQDLEHLNYNGFFQRFYIREEELQEEAIEEEGEQEQESRQNSSRAKKTAKKTHSKQSI